MWSHVTPEAVYFHILRRICPVIPVSQRAEVGGLYIQVQPGQYGKISSPRKITRARDVARW